MNVKPEDLVAIGAPVLETVNVREESSESLYDVIKAFYPVRPYQESFFAELCSLTYESLRNFIPDAVLPSV